ncbi:response regulator transcription factor [Alkalicoccus chagannorensis]|uniref:response regulator transcription factor n=1 Tax=Alkalicoccus chagannorensis TaxID=427072 RepID=UPI00040CA2BE|nr:response regulator transcription factor [Alkalicoccus chagannorensis]
MTKTILFAGGNEDESTGLAETMPEWQVIGVLEKDEFWKALRTWNIDGIVVSSTEDGWDGQQICRSVRESGVWVPLLFITDSCSEFECALHLELGVDDCMYRPVGMKELAARMKAAFRRESLGRRREHGGERNGAILTNGCIKLYVDDYLLKVQDQPVDVTRKEWELLHYLLQYPEQVHSRKQLHQMLYEFGESDDDRMVDVFISRIRGKIEKNTRRPEYIKTVRGVGYYMARMASSAG